jgi:hypothetical protein
VRLLKTFTALLLLTACASAPAKSPEPATTSPTPGAHAAHQHVHGNAGGPGMQHAHGGAEAHAAQCPMHVTGTHVSAEDPAGAAALRFDTSEDVAELQRRVTAMASKHQGKE